MNQVRTEADSRNAIAQKQLTQLLPAESAERLCAFWRGEDLVRPVLHITVRVPDHESLSFEGEPLSHRECDASLDWHLHCVRKQLGRRQFLAEAAPRVQFGHSSNIGLLPLLAGGDYAYHDGRAWVQPWPEALEAPLPRFCENHPTVQEIGDALDRACDIVGNTAFVNPFPLAMDALTTLSLFLGAEDLCMLLFEDPERVANWCSAFDDLLLELHRFMMRRLQRKGHVLASSWQHITAPGTFESLQCDFAAMLSPAMFKQFVLSSLQRQSEHSDYSLYHLDGTCQVRFLDALATLPGLTGIQWNPEPGQEILDWIPTYKNILDRGWRLHINSWDIKDLDTALAVVRALGPDNLSIALPTFDTVHEAESAIRAIESVSRKQPDHIGKPRT